jgi:hypothetical protein
MDSDCPFGIFKLFMATVICSYVMIVYCYTQQRHWPFLDWTISNWSRPTIQRSPEHNFMAEIIKLDQLIVVLEVVDHASLLQAKFGISGCPSVCPGKFNGSTLQRVKHCNMNDKSVSCTWWSLLILTLKSPEIDPFIVFFFLKYLLSILYDIL